MFHRPPMKCMEKRNIYYKLDKIMCSQIYVCILLLISFNKIVSSESGVKPMFKLTSVFYDHQSVLTITENMTIQHQLIKLKKEREKRISFLAIQNYVKCNQHNLQAPTFSSKLQKPSYHPHLQYSINTVSATKKVWLI